MAEIDAGSFFVAVVVDDVIFGQGMRLRNNILSDSTGQNEGLCQHFRV